MARTQRNKATERHFGVLKAKLAKLRRELITPKGGSSGPGEGFDVAKTGDARIGFVGENHRQLYYHHLFQEERERTSLLFHGLPTYIPTPPPFPLVPISLQDSPQ